MAKRKSKSRSKNRKIPLLASVGVGVYALTAYNEYKKNGVEGLTWSTIGVAHGKFSMDRAIAVFTPLAVGIGGSMLASKAGANKYLKVPYIKL
jgi:hypothetical protein